MGQKLSNLKGFFSIMERNSIAEVEGTAEENQNFLPASPDVISSEPVMGGVPNDNAANNHFESLYGTAASLASVSSTSSSLQDEENGNTSEQHTQSEPCTPQPNVSLRRGTVKSLSYVSGKRSRSKSLQATKEFSEGRTKKKRNHWVLKFNCTRLRNGCGSASSSSETYVPEPHMSCDSCVCTGYRRTEEHHLGAGVVFKASQDAPSEEHSPPSPEPQPGCSHERTGTDAAVGPDNPINPVIDLSKFNPDDYPIEDCDERARLERAREIAEGVEPPPWFQPGRQIQLLCPPDFNIDNLTALFQTHLGLPASAIAPALTQIEQTVTPQPPPQRMIHTQVDYIHCLVPDLLQITSCSFYWGKMDRYEAERLLDGRPEGTFLLRDSAQEEYLFSVSFRKYGRSLHARIEQWNHRFSFDSHDPGVFASTTVCGLIEHYKDPSCCMFFEPMLTIPLHRNFPFPLQHLCRAVVSSRSSYDGVNDLTLPKALKSYLKEYHYKQRVRVRRFDVEH